MMMNKELFDILEDLYNNEIKWAIGMHGEGECSYSLGEDADGYWEIEEDCDNLEDALKRMSTSAEGRYPHLFKPKTGYILVKHKERMQWNVVYEQFGNTRSFTCYSLEEAMAYVEARKEHINVEKIFQSPAQ